MLEVATVMKDFYMDLGRFVKSSEGCFFVFYEKGNYDIVCNKLEQENLFGGKKKNVCLFTHDAANIDAYLNEYIESWSSKNIFLGTFYDLVYDFLTKNNVVDIAGYKTERYVSDIIVGLFSSESIPDMTNVEKVKMEFYKRESENFLNFQFYRKKHISSGIVFKNSTKVEESLYSKYLKCKREYGFWDGEDLLFLLYKRLKEDAHLRTTFFHLLQDVFVLDFSTVTPLQRIILQECFSSESLYVFLIDANNKYYLDEEFKAMMLDCFQGRCFFLDFSSYSMNVFDCANEFLEKANKISVLSTGGSSIKHPFTSNEFGDVNPFSARRRSRSFFDINHVDEYNVKIITFLSSTIERKEADLISLAIKQILKENKVSPLDIVVFTTKEKRDVVISGLKRGGVKVSVNGCIGVRIEDIRDTWRINDVMKYVFIYGLSSLNEDIAPTDFYFALLSAGKRIFLSYSLMSDVGGGFVRLVRSKLLDMLDNRFVNEDVLTESKIALCNKEFSFDNKATLFSYSFIKKKSVVVRK